MSLAESKGVSYRTVKCAAMRLACRDESLRDGQSLDLLGSITTLTKVDAFNVLLSDIILAVRKGLNLVLHQVENVEPGTING